MSTTVPPKPLGYWFRFGPSHTRLHVTRWQLDAEEVITFTSACGANLLATTHEVNLATLSLPTTAVDALRAADSNQLAHLCPRCRKLFERAA